MKSIPLAEEKIDIINYAPSTHKRKKNRKMIPLSISLAGDISEDGGSFSLGVSSADHKTARRTFDELYKKLKKEMTAQPAPGGYQ